MPPPASPNVAWFLVNRSQFSAGSALTTTEPIISARTATAANAPSVAPSSTALLTRLRRLTRPVASRSPVRGSALTSAALFQLEALDDDLCGHVHDQREDEKDRRAVEERRRLER